MVGATWTDGSKKQLPYENINHHMPTTKSAFTVAAHFAQAAPNVRATYDAILGAARSLGAVIEDPKKTSIHLVRTHAFAGIATRRSGLILTLKANDAIDNPRVRRAQRASARRWHLEIPLAAPSDVDAELREWIRHSYDLS
jgi:hypothetical protein